MSESPIGGSCFSVKLFAPNIQFLRPSHAHVSLKSSDADTPDDDASPSGYGSNPAITLTLRSRKGYWLLAFLCLRANRELPRDWVASTIWPDSEVPRENLRRTLTDIRAGLGPAAELIEATHQSIAIRLPERQIDVLRFDRLLKNSDLASVEEAIALYSGPLLDECDEPWVRAERQARAEAYLSALERAGWGHHEAGRYPEALRYFRLGIALAPLRESLTRGVMQALADRGEVGEAITAYRRLRALMLGETGREPSADTADLYRSLRSAAKMADRQTAEKQKHASDRKHEAAPSRQEEAHVEASEEEATATANPEPPTNLPSPLTALLGREGDIQRITERLRSARLVTLTGAGGLGKTRLALEVASQIRGDFQDGVFLIDLAAVREPELVARAIAGAVDVREDPAEPLSVSLASALAERRVLLLLDNCEHLVAECARLARALISACPSLHILATSRQALRITGEWIHGLDPLTLPDLFPGSSEDAVYGASALRLFVERVASVRQDFTLDSETVPIAVSICRRLEGIPLAIELAAARSLSLSLKQIDALLTNRLRFLAGGDRAALPRQQSLRALVSWSFDLLSPVEQRFFSRLSVFSGGWTLEAAAFFLDDSGDRLDAGEQDPGALASASRERLWDALDLLDALVERSLVIVEPSAQPRYRMLETLREYAADMLSTRGETSAAQCRHVLWSLHFVEAAEKSKGSREQGDTLRAIAREHDNLRVALRNAGPGVERMRLAAATYWFWYIHGHYAEGKAWLERTLAETPNAPDGIRSRALKGAGDLNWAVGDMETARHLHTENLVLLESLRDRRGYAVTMNSLGLISYHQGDFVTACAHYAKAVEILRELDEPRLFGPVLANLALPLKELDRIDEAMDLLREAEALFRRSGDKRGLGQALHTLCLLSVRRGEYDDARAYVEESLADDRDLGDMHGVATGLHTLGEIALFQGRLDDAQASLDEALQLFQQVGARRSVAATYCCLGQLAFARGDIETASRHQWASLEIELGLNNRTGLAQSLRSLADIEFHDERMTAAATVLSAANRQMEVLGIREAPIREQATANTIASLRNALGPEAFDRAWAEGVEMSPEEAVGCLRRRQLTDTLVPTPALPKGSEEKEPR